MNPDPNKLPPSAPSAPPELIQPPEQDDYYIENGFVVFTAVHHLRRGTCCGSGCRHCPYK